MSSPRDDIQEVFTDVVSALEATKAPYAFIDALPVLAWGRVRATTDLDLVVVAENWPDVAAELERRGFVRGPTLEDRTAFVWISSPPRRISSRR